MIRHRCGVLLALLGVLSPSVSVWGLPPCGTPGTITTVTAPDGDYLATFGDYKSYLPLGLALGPQGRVYVADASLIYRLEADGTTTRIVGVPQNATELLANTLQDSVAVLDARIAPQAIAFDRHGRLYFADHVNRTWAYGHRLGVGRGLSRIARLDADGQVVTFAGTGEFGTGGDGGPAKEAQLGYIGSLVFDLKGHLLVAGDGGIRRIDRQGMISTLVEADQVTALIMDAQGRLYFTLGNQVFRRSAQGVIDHVAGSGADPGRDFKGDGLSATQVPLGLPSHLALDEQGNLYIADYEFDRIFRVRPAGLIETIAGTGHNFEYVPGCVLAEKAVVQAFPQARENRCFAGIGDGDPALEATTWGPWSMLLTQESDLLAVMTGAWKDLHWGGGDFSQLRRICRVSEWMVSPAATAVEEQAADIAEEAVSALRLYPNPFNAAVTIAFDLTHSASVSVRIYNELGQQVRVLAAEGVRPAGSYQFVWDGRDQAEQFQASGTYLLVLAVDGAVETHKLTLLH